MGVVFGTFVIGDTVSSLMSPAPTFTEAMVEFECVGVKGRETAGNVGHLVMVWGAFHFVGKTKLVIVDGNMNQQVYRQVLRQNLLPWQGVLSAITLCWFRTMLLHTGQGPP